MLSGPNVLLDLAGVLEVLPLPLGKATVMHVDTMIVATATGIVRVGIIETVTGVEIVTETCAGHARPVVEIAIDLAMIGTAGRDLKEVNMCADLHPVVKGGETMDLAIAIGRLRCHL